MNHPHPHAFGPPGEPIGHVPPPPTDPLEEPSATNRRLWIVAAFLVAIAVLAIVLTWQSLSSKADAKDQAAAARAACSQVEGLGQKCVTGDEQAPAADAVVPAEPSIAGSLRPNASSVPPDEAASQAAQPGGPLVNPGSDLIVGLTMRDGRLEVTYADGTVVDAGRVEGAPPAIVLPVGSPGPSPAPAPASSSSTDPQQSVVPQISPEDILPTDERPVPDVTEETYVP